MATLQLDGVDLHYDETGDGEPLVLVHGSAVDSTTWCGVVPALAETHRVITYDRRGYGRSRHRPVRDHRLHAADLVAVLETVAARPATVVGWSSGGNVALAVGTTRPDLLGSLVVVEPPLHGQRHMNAAVLRTLLRLKGKQLRGRHVEALEEFLRFGSALRSGGNTYDTLGEEARAELLRYPHQLLAEWDPHPYGVMHEHISTHAVAAIPVPLSWVIGGESDAWMDRLRERIARRRPGLDTVVVPGAGHLVHVDRPEDFVRVVRAASTAGSV